MQVTAVGLNKDSIVRGVVRRLGQAQRRPQLLCSAAARTGIMMATSPCKGQAALCADDASTHHDESSNVSHSRANYTNAEDSDAAGSQTTLHLDDAQDRHGASLSGDTVDTAEPLPTESNIARRFRDMQASIMVDINALNHKRFFMLVDIMNTRAQVIKVKNLAGSTEEYGMQIEPDAAVSAMIRDFAEIRQAQLKQADTYYHTNRRFVILVFTLFHNEKYSFSAGLFTIELPREGA